MSDAEIQRQNHRDAEYRRAFEQLTPEQRAELAAAGITGPDCDREPAAYRGERTVVGRDDDVGTLVDRSGGVEVDFAGSVDKLADQIAENFGVTREQSGRLADFIETRTKDALIQQISLQLARIVGFFLLSSDNLQARAHGLAHACHMAKRNGLRSRRHSAVLCGVSPEWMNRVTWRWCNELGLPPPEDIKSPAACAKYRDDKLTNHHRNRVVRTMRSPSANSSTPPPKCTPTSPPLQKKSTKPA